ncbi:MAG: hypothetical protein FJ298_13455, partial [Planctomycetes bacterium]|nr:hypothetical protein [Planctomycetota bacterium]
PVRAATTRRDGLAGTGGGGRRGFGGKGGPRGGQGGGGRPGGGRPPFKDGDRGAGGEREEGLSPQELRALGAKKAINNPFAGLKNLVRGEGEAPTGQ